MEYILHRVDTEKPYKGVPLSGDLRQEPWYPGNRVSGRCNSECKGTEAGICLKILRTSRNSSGNAASEDREAA